MRGVGLVSSASGLLLFHVFCHDENGKQNPARDSAASPSGTRVVSKPFAPQSRTGKRSKMRRLCLTGTVCSRSRSPDGGISSPERGLLMMLQNARAQGSPEERVVWVLEIF